MIEVNTICTKLTKLYADIACKIFSRNFCFIGIYIYTMAVPIMFSSSPMAAVYVVVFLCLPIFTRNAPPAVCMLASFCVTALAAADFAVCTFVIFSMSSSQRFCSAVMSAAVQPKFCSRQFYVKLS
jgi:hypothetical protein